MKGTVEEALFGTLIWAIASEEGTAEEDVLDLCVRWFWWSLA